MSKRGFSFSQALTSSRCENCSYLCILPYGAVLISFFSYTELITDAGHPQQEHETSHGSMSQTMWAVEGPDDTSVELEGRKFSSNDDGGPMLCNMVCKSMGRHVHIDICRGSESHNSETLHIKKRMSPDPDQDKDWITHALHWRRMGAFVV